MTKPKTVRELYACYDAALTKRPTDIFGLRYAPSLEPTMSDEADRHFDELPNPAGGMFSYANEAVLVALLLTLRPKVILEIGAWAETHRPHSSSPYICWNKTDEAWYFAVDIRDEGRRDFIHRPEYQRVFIQRDSSDITAVLSDMRGYMNPQHGLSIDLLLIDGWHSVSQTVRDWRYAAWVRPGGVVIMHDTTYHAGPRLVFEAVDANVFEKRQLFGPNARDELIADGRDFGMGLLRRHH